jgi:hypothetical protein
VIIVAEVKQCIRVFPIEAVLTATSESLRTRVTAHCLTPREAEEEWSAFKSHAARLPISADMVADLRSRCRARFGTPEPSEELILRAYVEDRLPARNNSSRNLTDKDERDHYDGI